MNKRRAIGFLVLLVVCGGIIIITSLLNHHILIEPAKAEDAGLCIGKSKGITLNLSQSPNAITLTWTVQNKFTPGIRVSYQVFRAEGDSGGNFQNLTGKEVVLGTELGGDFTDKEGLTPGKTYRYQVYGAQGTALYCSEVKSIKFNPASTTTPRSLTPPQNLQYKADPENSNNVILSWDPPKIIEEGPGEKPTIKSITYEIQSTDSSTGAISKQSTDKTTITLSQPPNTTYQYTVTAKVDLGNGNIQTVSSEEITVNSTYGGVGSTECEAKACNGLGWLQRTICQLGCTVVNIFASFVNWAIGLLDSVSGVSFQNVILPEKVFAQTGQTTQGSQSQPSTQTTQNTSSQTSSSSSQAPEKPPPPLSKSLSDTLQDKMIVDGWQYALSIIDVIVVFGILFIAFAHILKLNLDTYAVKKSLPWLVIGFVLAHFSLLFCRVFVDFATLLVEFFKSKALAQMGTSGLGTGLTALIFGPQTTGATLIGALIGTTLFTGLSGVGCLLVVIVLIGLSIPGLLILALAFLLYIRIYIILILTVLSPVAFVCLGFPPIQRYFGMWWSWFSKWVFLTPITYFIIALGSVIGLAKVGENSPILTGFQRWMFGIMVLGLALYVPQKLGGAVMAAWGRLGQKISGLEKGGYARKPAEEFVNRKTSLAKARIKTGEVPISPVPGIRGRGVGGFVLDKTIDREGKMREKMREGIIKAGVSLTAQRLKGEIEKMAIQKREETVLYSAFGGLFRKVQQKENEGGKLSVEDSRVQKLALNYFKDESSTYEFTPAKVLLEQLTEIDEKGRSLLDKYLAGELSGPEMVDAGAKIYALFAKQYSRNPQERAAATDAFQALAQRTTGNFNNQIESIPPNRWTTSRLLEAPARDPGLDRQLLIEKAIQLNQAVQESNSPLKDKGQALTNSQNLQTLISAIHELIRTTGAKIEEGAGSPTASIADRLNSLGIQHLTELKNQANNLENPNQRKRIYHDIETKLKLLYDININENPNNLDNLRQTVTSMNITEGALRRIADILPKQPGTMDAQLKATTSLQIQDLLNRVIPELAQSVNVELKRPEIERIKRNLAEEIIGEHQKRQNQEDLNSFLGDLRTNINTVNDYRKKILGEIQPSSAPSGAAQSTPPPSTGSEEQSKN